MRRRKLIAAFGGAAVAWPLIARAQQQAMPVIGWLGVTTAEAGAAFLAVFRKIEMAQAVQPVIDRHHHDIGIGVAQGRDHLPRR